MPHFENMLHRLRRIQNRDVCADLLSITVPEAFMPMKYVCLNGKVAYEFERERI